MSLIGQFKTNRLLIGCFREKRGASKPNLEKKEEKQTSKQQQQSYNNKERNRHGTHSFFVFPFFNMSPKH